MDPITVLALVSAAVKLGKEVIPQIRDAFANGEIPDDKQAEVRAQYESLRQQLGGEYQGPQWELSGR